MLYIAIVNYLDDFAGADRPELVAKSFLELGNLLVSCGLEESKEKACLPCTKMVFVRVLFNMEDNNRYLAAKKETSTLQELQSLDLVNCLS